MCCRYIVFKWLLGYMSTFNPSSRQIDEVTFVALLEVVKCFKLTFKNCSPAETKIKPHLTHAFETVKDSNSSFKTSNQCIMPLHPIPKHDFTLWV